MRLMAVATAAVAVMVVPAFAWNEPESFRGVPWGTSMQEARGIIEKSGEKPSCISRICTTVSSKIGPSIVSVSYIFSKDDKFEMAMLSFDPKQYSALRVIFEERYGDPSETKEEELKTRMGVSYQNNIARWAGERVMIELRRYGSRVDKGRAVVALKSAMDKSREEAEQAIKKGKDDL